MSVYGVDLAEWYAAGRWVALLDFIDMLPTANRVNEAIMNDPDRAMEIASAEPSPDPWAPRVSEFDLMAVLGQQQLHALQGIYQALIAQGGRTPPELPPFPGPRTAVVRAQEFLDREAAIDVGRMFGFDETDF